MDEIENPPKEVVKPRSRWNVLSRPATLGDVIAWILAASVLMSNFAGYAFMTVVPKYQMMMRSMHATLPIVTSLVFKLPPYTWVLLPATLSVGLVTILLTTKSDLGKVAAAVFAEWVICTVAVLIFLSFYMTLLELRYERS